MGLLQEIARSRVSFPRTRPYLPFSQRPRYGPYLRNLPNNAWRDLSRITNGGLTYRLAYSYLKNPLPMRINPTVGSDRRLWNPNKLKPATDVYGRTVSPTDVSIRNSDIPWEKIMNPPRKLDWRPKLSTQLKNAPWWYGFQNADKVWICLKRKMRKEIMHAMGIAGKTGQKSPHYNPYSHVRC